MILRREPALVLALLAVVACSQEARTPPPGAAPEAAEVTTTAEPTDVTVFVESDLRTRYGDMDPELRYLDGTTDLDGDGNPEVIVHVVSPMLCGSGGCTTLVFTPDGDGYRLVGEIGPGRPPIQALERTSNGWRNLLVHVSGGGIQPGYEAELEFDGSQYPSNPTVEPARQAADTNGAEVVIAEFESFTDASPLGALPSDLSDDAESQTAESTVDSELAGTSWRLVKIQSMDDTVHTPNDPSLYTLEFGEDGNASIQADCNRATGAWTSAGAGQVEFGVMAATQAMCSPGSLHDVYLGQFQWVRSYVLEDGHLFLATMADGAIIEFEPIID